MCGRPLAIPNQLGNNGPISFRQNGFVKPPAISSFRRLLPKPGRRPNLSKFRVGETSKQVTDLYTGLTETVTELTYDQAYCVANSSPALVGPPPTPRLCRPWSVPAWVRARRVSACPTPRSPGDLDATATSDRIAQAAVRPIVWPHAG